MQHIGVMHSQGLTFLYKLDVSLCQSSIMVKIRQGLLSSVYGTAGVANNIVHSLITFELKPEQTS